MNKSQRASETQSKYKQQLDLIKGAGTTGPELRDVLRPPSLPELKRIIEDIKLQFSDPFKKPSKGAKQFLKQAIAMYEQAVKASLGVPTYSENATLQYEAPNDIPTVPLAGLVPIQRTAYITKLASQGTTAGGFFATIIPSDFSGWVSTTSGANYFRVRKITSWTVPRSDGAFAQGTFAGVSVPVATNNSGTEVLPTWSENWEPVGQGFAGIVTKYPLGAYPLYAIGGEANVVICSHFTSLGGTGGVANVPVIFHVEIETLI